MKKLLAIVWKDSIIRFSSPMELLFFVLLPVIFTYLLANGTGGGDDGRIRLVVVDQARTPLSARLIAELGRSTSIKPDPASLAEAEAQYKDRTADILLIIPPDFDGAHLQEGTVTLEVRGQPNDLDALVAERAVRAAAGRIGSAMGAALAGVRQAEAIRPFASEAERQAYFEEALADAEKEMDAAPGRLSVTRAATPDTVDYDPAANSSAGQMLTWVVIPLFAISGLFASERTQGTLRRLLTTPTSRGTFLLGTIAGQVLAALVQMLILVGFGMLVLKVNWGRDPGALLLLMLASALAAAAIGTALGTFIKTERQAEGLSILLGMVMAMMGGCWYPLELFPPFIQTAVHVLPTTWAMQGLLDLVLRGQGLTAILPEAGVLGLFAAVFFSIGVWRFRFE